MLRNNIREDYFRWMSDIACDGRYSKHVTYDKLLRLLFSTEFTWLIPLDENRAADGISLRYRFAVERGYRDIPEELDGPCSVLEMILMLALRCEENIMDDPEYGDRKQQWFWSMINNLGLGSMYDIRFDLEYCENVIRAFLDREYEPNGKGGLFTIKNCDADLRDVEIWYQLCWYLDSYMHMGY